MNIKIKRIDKTLPLPEYQTKGSVGFDLYAREKTVVQPFVPCLIPLNIIVKVPKNYLFLLASRSSLPIKKGLLIPNGVGIIDHDYCGEEDEIKLQVLNFTDKPVVVNKGERIAQGIIVSIKCPNFIEVTKMSQKSRGGFGSTG